MHVTRVDSVDTRWPVGDFRSIRTGEIGPEVVFSTSKTRADGNHDLYCIYTLLAGAVEWRGTTLVFFFTVTW